MHVLLLNADSAPINYLPLSTLKWQAAIRAVYLGAVNIIEEYETWDVHSPSVTMRVPSVVMTKKYLNVSRNIAFSKDNIYLRDRYTCQYCNNRFEKEYLTLDHVLPCSHGGTTTWDNITTSCSACNHKKGNNKHIVPKKLPRKPTYYELLSVRKEFAIQIPCETWKNYMDWPDEKIFISGNKILQSSLIF